MIYETIMWSNTLKRILSLKSSQKKGEQKANETTKKN